MAKQLFDAGIHVLENDRLRAGITSYGGRLMSLLAPDRDGRRDDVVLGFDTVAPYATAGGSFGALLGRVANRIAGARFTLDGQVFDLASAGDGMTLHGGPAGFGVLDWDVRAASGTMLALGHVSPDGDQGFPGTLTVEATYTLAGDTLHLAFAATTTKPTPVNLSNHSYFNLGGHHGGRRDILGHVVTIAADAWLPTTASQIPTGEIRAAEGTPFDLRRPTVIGARIRQPDPQLLLAHGYDHSFVLTGSSPAVRLHDPASGRVLEITTTQPAVQFYTGNNLTGAVAGRGGAFRQSDGVAFEAQGFPDAINQPGFPSTVLRPGETYRQEIAWRFSVA